MGWRSKILVFVALGVFVFGCVWLGYAVNARTKGNEYMIQLAASFNAAMLINAEETFTDPDRAIISACEGQRYIIIPENYSAVLSLLHKDHVMPMIRRVGKDAPLSISICGSTSISIEPDRDSVDGALILFVTDTGKRFTKHVRGGNFWTQILEYTTVGFPTRHNLPLQPMPGIPSPPAYQ